MFTRLRWFLYGALASLGATAYVVTRLRRMRERLTAESVARVSALGAADLMALAGRRLANVADPADVTVARIGRTGDMHRVRDS